jgi:hypothetical protein
MFGRSKQNIQGRISHSHVAHFFSILHHQYSFATLPSGAHSFGIRSAYTAYTLSVCGSHLCVAPGIYCSRPNVDAWHPFYLRHLAYRRPVPVPALPSPVRKSWTMSMSQRPPLCEHDEQGHSNYAMSHQSWPRWQNIR